MSNTGTLSDEAWNTARQLLASALEMAPAEIADGAGMDQLHNWDSLSHIRLMLALEAYINAPLAPDVIVSIGSLRDIAHVVQAFISPVKQD